MVRCQRWKGGPFNTRNQEKKNTHIGLPEQIADRGGDQAGKDESDPRRPRRQTEVAPSVLVEV